MSLQSTAAYPKTALSPHYDHKSRGENTQTRRYSPLPQQPLLQIYGQRFKSVIICDQRGVKTNFVSKKNQKILFACFLLSVRIELIIDLISTDQKFAEKKPRRTPLNYWLLEHIERLTLRQNIICHQDTQLMYMHIVQCCVYIKLQTASPGSYQQARRTSSDRLQNSPRLTAYSQISGFHCQLLTTAPFGTILDETLIAKPKNINEISLCKRSSRTVIMNATARKRQKKKDFKKPFLTFVVDLKSYRSHTLIRLQVEPHLMGHADYQIRNKATR